MLECRIRGENEVQERGRLEGKPRSRDPSKGEREMQETPRSQALSTLIPAGNAWARVLNSPALNQVLLRKDWEDGK